MRTNAEFAIEHKKEASRKDQPRMECSPAGRRFACVDYLLKNAFTSSLGTIFSSKT